MTPRCYHADLDCHAPQAEHRLIPHCPPMRDRGRVIWRGKDGRWRSTCRMALD